MQHPTIANATFVQPLQLAAVITAQGLHSDAVLLALSQNAKW